MRTLPDRLAALSPQKRELLETHLHDYGAAYHTFPLSYAQQRLWLLDQLHPGNVSYNITTIFYMHGPLQLSLLTDSFTTLLARHDVLRTAFIDVRGQPMQSVVPPMSATMSIIDLTTILRDEERIIEVQRITKQEELKLFDFAQSPLARFIIIRLAPHDHQLLVSMPHRISDGWSVSLLTSELCTLYRAGIQNTPMTLPALPIQYADYAVWQRTQAYTDEQVKQVAYWCDHLRNAPPFLAMPTDFPRPAIQTYTGGTVQQLIPKARIEKLQAIGLQEHATLFMVLLAIFQVLLYRQTGQPDLVIGIPIANRNRSEIEGLIGFFVNMLPLRTNLEGDPSFYQLLARTRETALSSYAYQDVAFDLLVKELNPVRDLSYPPIFQVIFNMINVPEFQQDWDDLAVDVQIPLEIGAKVDFTLYLEATADGMRLDLVYNSDLFTPARMDTLLTQYCSLIEQVISLPTNPISSLSLLTPATVLLLPDPTAPLSSHWEGAVQTLFTQQAIKNPTKIAIEEDTNRWSYHDLDARSNQLAHFLGDQGIALGDVVAIYASRSASLVWAILGTLKAGATYTILDPAYPSVRLSEYLEQAQPHGLILLDEAGILPKAIRDQVAQIPLCCQITLPRSYEGQNNMFLSEYPTTPTTIGVGPDDLASITFTSGSTGRPKGILQRHGPLTHFLPWQQVTFDLSKEDRYTLLSGLSHDPLQRDIFTPLCLGATICIPSQSEMGMPGWLPQWMERTDITVTNLTPAMVQLVTQPLGNKTATMMPLLRYAFIVGDALRRHDVVRLWELAPNVTAVNMYGSTETQRAVSYYSIPHSHTANQSPVKEIIPLGQGAQDVQLLICTSTNQLAGVGEIGEILIRSPHLAQGYLNNSDLTRERFIANPFRQNPEDGCYRTGDLGRYLPNGHVEYLARSDQQVKIRGFRIELGEIEAALKELDIVRDAIVVIHEDERLDKRLIAYVVPLFEIVASDIIARLRQHLQNKLPIYMVPATFVVLAEIPLTPNGKLDRQSLPLPQSSVSSTVEFSTPMQILLGKLWCEVLGRDQVGLTDNFFDLGGHSLLATQLIARIIEATGAAVTLRALFEAPTIDLFAALLAQTQAQSYPLHRPALMAQQRPPFLNHHRSEE